jgi:hypothetical protein
MFRHPRTALDFIANFDSSSGMVQALGRFLHGKDFSGVGILPPYELPARVLNALPIWLREQLYIAGGWIETVEPDDLATFRAEIVNEWVVNQYPDRSYPAAMIGSSNGAMIHLCAALGIPWLPQTVLIPIHHDRVHPDEFRYALEAFRPAATQLLEANPSVELHHMHDPNQDRLMIQKMGYFRIKQRALGAAYEHFLEDHVPAGGTIFIVECTLHWPVKRVAERHVFQLGALGGATPDEYVHGSQRVEAYLSREGSHRRLWDPPPPDEEQPEAEWGFAEALRDDVVRLARRRGWHVRRILFEQPEDFSPLVADLYRWWYAQQGVEPNRLLVESFILLEPWWALRNRLVPFWMVFNKQPSFEAVNRYLDTAPSQSEIYLTLFSHGVNSIGLVPIDQWRSVCSRAARAGGFLGVDERAFPRDFAVFVRFHRALTRLQPHHPMPPPLAVADLDRFLDGDGHDYRVEWRNMNV